MDSKVVQSSDWLRKLAERVGIGERDDTLPDWVVDELRTLSPAENTPEAPTCIADIPPVLKRRLQDEAIQQVFHRLETPLRFLLYATVPGQEPGSIRECHDILNMWRQGLEKEARLVPDAYSGAVIPYEPLLERAYHINGRCEPGDPLQITIPAWRIHGVVVVRGEAELLEGSDGAKEREGEREMPERGEGDTGTEQHDPLAPATIDICCPG
jgi:hypothetical protein